MLKISHKGPPPTIAEVIAYLQTLPPEMVCMNRRVEFGVQSVSITSIDDPVGSGTKTGVSAVELRLELP